MVLDAGLWFRTLVVIAGLSSFFQCTYRQPDSNYFPNNGITSVVHYRERDLIVAGTTELIPPPMREDEPMSQSPSRYAPLPPQKKEEEQTGDKGLADVVTKVQPEHSMEKGEKQTAEPPVQEERHTEYRQKPDPSVTVHGVDHVHPPIHKESSINTAEMSTTPTLTPVAPGRNLNQMPSFRHSETSSSWWGLLLNGIDTITQSGFIAAACTLYLISVFSAIQMYGRSS
ncbi:hypothetical protein Pelo_10124 [Pelomyxa schiedti]|nr:hypothetical protein Pelo_10124 [Pelomyxa schiedti]